MPKRRSNKKSVPIEELLEKWGQLYEEEPPEAVFASGEPVKVIPSLDVPVAPSYPRKDDSLRDIPTLQEGVRVAANTANALKDLGMGKIDLDVDPEEPSEQVEVDEEDAVALFKRAYGEEYGALEDEDGKPKPRRKGPKDPATPIAPTQLFNTYTAMKLASILGEYDKKVVDSTVQMRTYVTNRLIELSKCGDTKSEIRALELLGKISDVGLFAEKTEIKVTHTTESLQHAIKDRVSRLTTMLGQQVNSAEDAEFKMVTEAKEPVDGDRV